VGYYHIKNIRLDKKGNKISADFADNNWQPLDWFHVDDLAKEKNGFDEKYANLIYNLVAGNFHPVSNSVYSRIVMNHYLKNYYQDAYDIGELATYNKYKGNIEKLFDNNDNECIEIKSDRELNPEKYYVLDKYDDSDLEYKGEYYVNQVGEIFCIKDNKLMTCDNRKTNYGYPISEVYYDKEKYYEYNDFLKNQSKEDEMEM